MSHFAKIDENSIVTQVLVIEQDVVDTGLFGDPASFVQTSYNTRGGVHYGQDGQPDGGVALRGNYAGIGYIYDKTNDVFYPPKPFNSWVISAPTWQWQAPIAQPSDGKPYMWDEATDSWVIRPAPHPSWTLVETTVNGVSTWNYQAPTPMPSDAGTGDPLRMYYWDEPTLSWVLIG